MIGSLSLSLLGVNLLPIIHEPTQQEGVFLMSIYDVYHAQDIHQMSSLLRKSIPFRLSRSSTRTAPTEVERMALFLSMSVRMPGW